MPSLYMLVGVPGSGKSTWRAHANLNHAVMLSTDDWIEAKAASQGKTYSEVFDSEVGAATQSMMRDLAGAIKADQDIVWDQTNLTAKSRARKLRQIPASYRKVAVFFPNPSPEELARRLAGREGKTIPAGVIKSMISQLEMPTTAEGFDEVITAI